MRSKLGWLVVAALVGGFAVVACGDDDEDCAGEILNSCADCECTPPREATCTAHPKGDAYARERCCVCE
ncbi:MAG: hypothetical protein ACAI38_07940 [Myxococcota bacterium]